MRNSEIKKLIEEGFDRMHLISHQDWRDYRREMFDDEVRAERHHRANFHSDITRYANSATLVAKFFCVNFMLNAMKCPSIKPSDILYSKRASLIAKGCFDVWSVDLINAFKDFDHDTFNKLDYEQGIIVHKQRL
jgi:hypothetical protein